MLMSLHVIFKKYQLSKTAKFLGGKSANIRYSDNNKRYSVLNFEFLKTALHKASSISVRNFQRKVIVLFPLNIQN